jgi:hypothetical protein
MECKTSKGLRIAILIYAISSTFLYIREERLRRQDPR